ncbi:MULTISPECIES: DNA polymerase III subunit chi [Comamonas]|uniref:DNA polymerase III subunit chi n=1 Tax=Comamonas aquatica TaxID=225991 RepID=A0AA42HV66_9BURK|nr:DNA polymerase III subunit chi [Comamonas aquatica]MDE1555784.1 DNA polymerase III subunit chi [Comamonas aquatica]MDH0363561.1 DNA polymerase III subunit chi [Comamonas aquatica]MDH1765837.1 DNA polymerase III subunit chi [Comamonas aquatica]
MAESPVQVAFHFNAPDKLDYACRFIRKALRHDARVTVVAPMEHLRQLSAKLWKYAGHEFLAHALQGDDAELLALAPVALVEQAQASAHREVLLNLGLDMPQGFEAFAKVVEVVSSFDDEDRAHARVRWRAYQSAGHAIERHDLVLKGN